MQDNQTFKETQGVNERERIWEKEYVIKERERLNSLRFRDQNGRHKAK